MLSVYETESYRSFVDSRLRARPGAARRHGIIDLANALRCHPTFIAKVLSGKADFSLEQAFVVCEWLALSPEDSDYFLDLVCRDRATNPRLKQKYEHRLQRAHAAKSRLSQKIQQSLPADPAVLQLYYKSWLPQVIHIASQIPELQEVKTLGAKLGIASHKILEIGRELESAGIIKIEGQRFISLVNGVHLPSSSPLVHSYHAHWRSKVMNDLASQRLEGGIHYSAVMSVSAEVYHEMMSLIANVIAEVRKKAEDEISPQQLIVHTTDFCRIL